MGSFRGMSIQLSLTPGSALALSLAMALLAAVPSTSVLFVVARAGVGGFRQGLFAAVGIVAGDIVHLLAAVLGGVLLVKVTGAWWSLLYWIGGAYMFSLAWGFKGAHPAREEGPPGGRVGSHWASFMGGLLITLGDQKAVFFYLGFLPGFVDLTSVSKADIVVMVMITAVSVGGVKAAYAALASKAPGVLGQQWGRWTHRAARVLLATAGLLLWAKALGA